ncbi:TPA: argininosuccinate lyase, partial [Candidatus Sumerlaeota bacterium]|nr:argininosuccinate lyase [Candidatus Sumerlaeota bacterium]
MDRAYAAKLMGFDGPQENSLDSVTNRSEFESRVAGVLAVFAQHAATLAQDLILFSSPPWSLMRIGDAYVTGSSIMPQKRNPDFAEVTKAKAALAGASAALLIDLTRGDPSGY